MKYLPKFLGKKKNTTVKEQKEDKRELLKKRYQLYQELLSNNNTVLELMADMEEKLSGEFFFDRHYINQKISEIAEGVKIIIDRLNEISNNKFFALHERFLGVVSNIEKLLTRRREIPLSSYTIPFDKITKEIVDSLGNKNANLGEVRNHLRIPTPEGFAISAFAFKRFMEHNKIFERIRRTLFELRLDNLEVLNNKSFEIQDLVMKAEIHQELEREIMYAYSRLCDKYGKKVMVSVRSSALQEDGEFSFAGQYATFLNVTSDLILQRYKEVIASLFTPRAIFYYKTKGLHEHDMVMSVGVLEMIDAKAAGVMYSRDPNRPKEDTLIISAARGLGKSVVEGVVTPEAYVLSRDNLEIIERNIPEQKAMFVCRADGEIEEVSLPVEMKGKPSLSEEEIKTLAEYAIAIENHYESPQDIEWAIDKGGRPYILQTRPLMILTREPTRPVPIHVAGYNILIDKGIIACKGIGFGKAYIVRTEEDLENFPEGAVLVAKHTSAKYVTVMNKASAIITDVGGTAGHMASLAREFQVPTILDTEIATEILKDRQEITVDAINCNIYEGHVKELEEFAEIKEDPLKGTQLFKTLEGVLKWVVPLNLVDPEDVGFKPEFCETLHDITRFCHEMAMREMFTITEIPSQEVEVSDSPRLVAPIPMEVYLIDLGGGIKGAPKKLTPEYIYSIPFNAFCNGLTSMKWPEPRPFDIKGFMSMVAHTATIPEGELYRIGDRSFSFITREYMNFSIRLGYHLSTVEAYAGESINDNYLRFFFKGGGAGRDRRFRRVRLVSEILKRLDFNVKVVEDLIDASITKYKKPAIEKRLEVLGKLTAYTKQLDMVMYNDAITDMYIEDFVKEHIKGKI
ncbi:MAG: PEP/pyruvate-binding domain-containing protein [Thermodesulfovibrionales bacterium]|nr:PEP/pyruvate-binding domain-containing protein [Thermodesulfovibrionales bacterium]